MKLWLTIVIKILLLVFFSSELNKQLFFPFVNTLVEFGVNPWQYYLEHGLHLDAFPYHAMMLYLLYPFSLVSHLIGVDFIFKIPLVLADLGIFYILLKIFPNKKKKVFIFYFCNPIVIYAIYIHSQLDIIPMALLMYGLYLLNQKKLIFSAIMVGFALATKLHILIALPLIVFYIYKIENFILAVKYFIISIAVLLTIDLPFLFSDGFINMVLLNQKQSLIFDSFYQIGEIKLLLPIASILMVYFHFFNQKKVNRDLLYFYFGILFTVTIFLIYPAPAWYVWLVPFISIYFIQNLNEQKSILLYATFSSAYLIFFVFFYHSEYKDILFLGHYINLKIENSTLTNVFFTLLESILLAIMYAFYKYGIKSNSIYKKQTNLAIGIGGDSGVGKSSLLANLTLLFQDKLLQIEGDGEHKWERGDENWNKYTHLDPKANFIHKQADALSELKHNHVIYRSEYDHATGKFTIPSKVEPKEIIAISGLHPFYLPKLRKVIDIKIYLDTDEKLRRHWKILRDTKKRGYSMEKILTQIEARVEDTIKYIYPQKSFADLVISYFGVNDFEMGKDGESIGLGLKITLDANIHLENLLERLDVVYEWDYNEDLKTQYLILKKEPTIDFEILCKELVPNLYEVVDTNSEFKSSYEGLLQYIVVQMVSEKLKEENR